MRIIESVVKALFFFVWAGFPEKVACCYCAGGAKKCVPERAWTCLSNDSYTRKKGDSHSLRAKLDAPSVLPDITAPP